MMSRSCHRLDDRFKRLSGKGIRTVWARQTGAKVCASRKKNNGCVCYTRNRVPCFHRRTDGFGGDVSPCRKMGTPRTVVVARVRCERRFRKTWVTVPSVPLASCTASFTGVRSMFKFSSALLILIAISTPAHADIFGIFASNGGPEQVIDGHAYGPTQSTIVDGSMHGYPFYSGCCEQKSPCCQGLWCSPACW